MDFSPPGFSIHGISQGRILERVAISSSRDLPKPCLLYWQADSLPLRYLENPVIAAQSCLTLCSPMDCSLLGSSVHGILQARILEWVATSFSSAWKWKVKVKLFSCVWLLATPWTAACQAPPSMGFSRQECWSGLSPYTSSNSCPWSWCCYLTISSSASLSLTEYYSAKKDVTRKTF